MPAAAQTIPVPDVDTSGATQTVEDTVSNATGQVGSTAGQVTGSGSSSGTGSAATPPIRDHDCPPSRQTRSGGVGGGARSGDGGGGGSSSALLASRSDGVQKAVEGNGWSGGVLGTTTGEGSGGRESAPSTPLLPADPDEFPFSIGLVLLGLLGLGFAGVVAAVTNHVLSRGSDYYH